MENVSTEEDRRSRGVGREPLARSSSSRLRLIVRRGGQWWCGARRATKLTGEQLGAYAALLRRRLYSLVLLDVLAVGVCSSFSVAIGGVAAMAAAFAGSRLTRGLSRCALLPARRAGQCRGNGPQDQHEECCAVAIATAAVNREQKGGKTAQRAKRAELAELRRAPSA